MLRDLLSDVRFRLRALFRRDDVERELADEIQLHIDVEADRLVRDGLAEGEARRQARLALGGVEQVKEATRDARGLAWLDSLSQDLRYALRGLRRNPGFTIAAVLTLALGIGANTTMFGLLDALLLRPPAGVRDPDGLVWIAAEYRVPPEGLIRMLGVSYPDFVEFSRSASLAGTAAYNANVRWFGHGADQQEIRALTVNSTFMPLLGARPVIGRFFTADDEREGAPNAVILSYDFWQQRFGGATDVLGRTAEIGANQYTVIGVAPRNFNGVERERVDVYLPIPAGPTDERPPKGLPPTRWVSGYSQWVFILGRPRPGVRIDRMADELNTVYHRRAGPDSTFNATLTIRTATPTGTIAIRSAQQKQNAMISVWLEAVAFIVLLIACVNVANLTLARALRRQREIAIRLTLGVSRWRLVRLLTAESLALSGVGCLAALLLARWGGSIVRTRFLPEATVETSALGVRVLLVTLGAALVTMLVCGLVPAIQATRPNLITSLKGLHAGGAPRRGLVRTALLVGQVALTVILLVGASLFVRSSRLADAVPLGFDADHLLRVRLDGGRSGDAELAPIYRRLSGRLAAIPGVQRIALAAGGPLGNAMQGRISIPGRRVDDEDAIHIVTAIDPEFFATLGISLRSGRIFVPSDGTGSEHVAVVNEEMAHHYWPAGDALGQCIKVGRDTVPCTTIVGIVGNTHRGINPSLPYVKEQPWITCYVPLDPERPGQVGTLYVRTIPPATSLVTTTRRIVQAMSPEPHVAEVTALSTLLAPQIRPWRLGAMMFGIFGVLALALALVGLYGVLAYSVGQRTHEIGVRVALGAQRREIVWLVLQQGLITTVIGVAVGTLSALGGGHALASLLFGVSPNDPQILSTTVLAFLAVAALASYLPARRALLVDPLEALRAE
jgi:putative ABC transport system permease protein